LVGSALQEQTSFDHCYSSKNFQEIKQLKEDIDHLVLCCLPATKWKVNQDPQADLQNIFAILDALTDLYTKRMTIISTIDIYGRSEPGQDETSLPPLEAPGYGANRFLFEEFAPGRVWHETLQVVRLPALYHRLIKKNILFDLINNHEVEKINANSRYQWYPLARLWNDLQQCPVNGTANLFPAPIETTALLNAFFPEAACSMGERIAYNHLTIHTESGYWPPSQSDNFALIGEFIHEARS
jgi:hypothetical protein